MIIAIIILVGAVLVTAGIVYASNINSNRFEVIENFAGVKLIFDKVDSLYYITTDTSRAMGDPDIHSAKALWRSIVRIQSWTYRVGEAICEANAYAMEWYAHLDGSPEDRAALDNYANRIDRVAVWYKKRKEVYAK